MNLRLWLVVFGLLPALAGESLGFRGPQRNGVFPAQGLLKDWNSSAPQPLWQADGLGAGYSSLAVSQDGIYTTGAKGSQGYVFKLDLEGKPLWQTAYGELHHGSGYPGSRSTPTIDGDHVYVMSSMGKVVCLDAANGSIRWQVDTLDRFSASTDRIPQWGIAESLLVDGERLICTPGAKGATIVALNKHDGKTLWQCRKLSDRSGYCSPRIFEYQGLRLVVTMTAKQLVAVDASNGELIWQVDYPASWDIHANTPVVHGNLIYVSDGYRHGGRCFEVSADGRSVKQKWKEGTLDVHHGGIVAVDGIIYGSSNRGHFTALDFETGEVLSSIPRAGKGSTIYADGRLYLYTERGEVKLIDPSPRALKHLGSLKIEAGSAQHWAHPVITDGRLYIRHGNAMMAFDLKST